MKLGPKQKQWVKDLRAGYPKCTGRLAEGNLDAITGFCCLGVYAHTQIKSPWEFTLQRLSFDSGRAFSLGNNESGELGLRNSSGRLLTPVCIGGSRYTTLAGVNDGAGKDHAWMADFIVKHKDNIFTRSA